MATIPSTRAADSNPLWATNHFDPLGRDRRPRREAAPLAVIEQADGTVTLITPNRT